MTPILAGWYKAAAVRSAAFDVVFLPERRAYTATGPVPLYLAAAGAGILVEQPCGSQGVCGHCRVRVVEGDVPRTPADEDHLSEAELAAGWRLACQVVLSGPAAVVVPAVTRSLAGKSFGDRLAPEDLAHPVVDLLCVALPPGGSEQASLLDRLAVALGRRPRTLSARPRALAELARAAGVYREVFVAMEGDELIAARPGGRRPLLGLAVDLGTTSLAAALVRLDDGTVVTSASRLNPQVAMGADVISRIQHTMDHDDGLQRLTAAVRDGVESLVRELVLEAGRDADDIVTAAVAGNPTMVHAWAGVAIAGLGIAPYLGAFAGELSCKAADVGLSIHPNANVYSFPQVRSHVGGDAVAAAIAAGVDRPGACRLLVDLGTNSEIIVACGNRVVATSAAAGPAFEGVSIRHGMRAAPGALDVVTFGNDGRLVMNTVAGAPATGICGSGLIDIVAEMLRVELVAASGYLRRREELDEGAAGRFARHLTEIEAQQAFRLAPDAEMGWDAEVVLTARDIREVQLAKGSIITAATLACRHLRREIADLDEVLVAGAFGNYIRKASALRIGLVPRIDPERIRLVGNAAGVGARLALLDRDVRARARALAQRAEYVDLATHGDYQATFIASLAFPEA